MLVPIVSGLLSSVEKLSNSMQNLEYALPALELIQEILSLLKDSTSQYRENKESLPQSVENFNRFYVKMCHQIQRDEKDVLIFSQQFATFKQSSAILY